VSVSSLVLEPAHSLLRQSYAPADMRGGGTINADGFGAGWYPEPDGPAARYRTAQPIWSDASFGALAATTRSGAMLAAVRSATVGMPVTESAAAPFQDGRWLFSHNGVIRGWPHRVAVLAAALPVVDLLTLDAPTDAALLWALVRHRLRAGDDPADALVRVIGEVAAVAPESRLNLLLTDGKGIWATAVGHALSVHTDERSVLVASEPLDPTAAWSPVPNRHLVVAAPGRCRTTPLPGDV
jgi:glutamine amidotransferase